MLKALFSSNARIKILKLFLGHENGKEFFVRELTRELDEQINSVRRELENLEKIGMMQSRLQDRKKYYRLNPHFIILPELRSLFQKSEGIPQKILKKAERMGRLDLLVLTGSFVNRPGNIDMAIVGTLDKNKLSDYLSRELTDGIRYSVFSREDFLYRLECNDKIANELISNPQNLILTNKIEKKIREASSR